MVINPFLNPFWLNQLIRKNLYEGMVLDFIQEYVKNIRSQVEQPQTLESWSARNIHLRTRLLNSLGLTSFPEKNPLNPRRIGTIERDSYLIEKIVFEPRYGFIITAHLYIPKDKDHQSPAILYVPGHWIENGKLEPDIQIACANLANLGFVVLVFDPIGQGERFGSWRDHGHKEILLPGLSQEGMMVWESMRAIDYLMQRPEVDPHRIGMTGASGGGLNTLYTCAIDNRIQVSIPVCFVTTFLSMMTAERDRNWEDGVDLCNQVPGVMAFAEMSDLCGLFAPRPMCIIASRNDWMFPIQGTHEVAKEVSRLYQLAGVSDHFRLSEVEAPHGYYREMREAAYDWFSFWLMGKGAQDLITEQAFPLFPAPYPSALTYMYPPTMADLSLLREYRVDTVPSEGLCLPPGIKAETGTVITNLARTLSKGLPPKINVPQNQNDWLTLREALLERVREVLGTFPKINILKDWIYLQGQHKGIFYERIEFESEPGIRLPSLFFAPANWEDKLPVVIYLDEGGKENGLINGLIPKLLYAGIAVLAVDVRGTGETSVSDFEAATNALMTDRPLFGQQVWDVRRAVDELWQRIFISIQVDKGRIGCFGRGSAGLLALYATALDERLKTTFILESPLSYHSLITEEPDFPTNLFLFGVLKNLDLPQVIGLAAPRSLMLLNPVDGNRQPLPADQCEASLHWPQKVYELLTSKSSILYEINSNNQSINDKVVDYFLNHL